MTDTTEHPCYGEPNLSKQGDLLHCLSCGAFQRLNPESGNVVWFRAGRVISAPVDMLQAKQWHDDRYGTDHASS